MTFTLTATPEPLNEPPRVLLEAVESDADLALQTVEFFRDGAPLRFEAAITGDQAVAYDYDAPFDQVLVYRADGTELGSPIDWTEVWTDTAAWTGSGWAAAAGVVSSTAPASVIHRDASDGSIIALTVTSPTNLTIQLTDSADAVVVSVLVSPDGTVTLTGSTASKVTGSGTFTLSLSESTASIAGTGWSTSVGYTGSPTRVRLVAPQVATYVSKFGSYGIGNGQFLLASGIAIDASGNIYVTDSSGNRVQKFNSSGVYQSQFGTPGSGNGQFAQPHGITIDTATGDILVADTGNDRVQRFNSAGVYQSKFGTAGGGNGQFNNPRDLAIDGSGNIFVTDTDNARVQKFNSAGVYQSQFGTLGLGDGEFSLPSGIAIDGSGNMWVTDAGAAHFRVQKFNSAGVYQSKFGTPGSSDGQFNTPRGIVLDGSGNIWVADENNDRIQKFNSSGVFQAKFGSAGSGDGQVLEPIDLAIDAAGDVLVADTDNFRVQKFTTDVGSTDDIVMRIVLDEPEDVTATDTATLTPTGATAGAWLTNAAIPDLAILMDTNGQVDADYFIVRNSREETTLATNTQQLEIEGSPYVMTVALGPRKYETWTLFIACTTEVARSALLSVLANDAPISLRFPATGYEGLTAGFYAIGDVDTERIGHPMHDHVTVVSLPLTPARAPKFKPLWQWNYNTSAQTGLSYDDLSATYASYNDLLVGPG